ncbi:unnamed protein product [Alternaria alternata]
MALSDDHSVRKYAYEALQSSRHIRLIILHSASSTDAPLNFTFQQAKLSELEGRYEAISYTWGQPNLTYPLFVSDGTHVLVTENLDRALRYLRHSHKDRALWADAACINQADDVEKGTQIPLMVHIFRNAETVLAWLDPGPAHDILIDIDYSLDLQQTYETFALACIRAGKLDTIIEAVLSRQHSARPQGWASWAPDWRVSWLEPVILPVPVRFLWPLKPEELPPGVIGVKVTTWSCLLDVRYKAYPIILGKAVGDTWPEQCSNLCTKFTGTNAAEDLRALCDMLRYMVQQLYGPTDLGALLEQELQCTRSKAYATVSQRDPDLRLMNLAALQSMLNMMIGPRKNMFLFEIPGAERRSVGYGNAHLEVGDQLVPLFEMKSARKSSLGAQVVKMVLIVRCAGTNNTKPSPETIYRLVGSGYVYDTAAIEDYDSYLRDEHYDSHLPDKDYSSYERHKTFSNGTQRLYLA